jgi:hypothetical protein
VNEGGRAWALDQPATIGLGPRVDIKGITLRAGNRSIALTGVVDRHGASDMTLRIASSTWNAPGGARAPGGRLDGQLHGPAANPQLQGGMDLTIRSSQGTDLGTVGSSSTGQAKG